MKTFYYTAYAKRRGYKTHIVSDGIWTATGKTAARREIAQGLRVPARRLVLREYVSGQPSI